MTVYQSLVSLTCCLFLLLLALFGHTVISEYSKTPPQTAQAIASIADPIPVTDEVASPITDMLSSMTLEEKVGQLFMIGHWRQNDFHHTANLLRAHHFGGVIIMSVAPENTDFVSVWTKKWREDSVVLPPLIAIDQEGGVVSRLRAPGYDQTAQRELRDADHAYTIGATRGAELAALGINVNLAPVLDQSLEADSFLYKRAFATSSTATQLAHALIAGHAAHNVAVAIKHYPGHYDNEDDSHTILPVIPIPQSAYNIFTRIFDQTIEQSYPPIVMTAHVIVPNVDPTYPATLSETILTGKLRDNLGYEGVIMTDDMTMGAITNQWDSGDAAVQAIKAGADMILFAADPDAGIQAVTRVLEAVAQGEISEDRINQSVERILRLKQNFQ